MATKENYKLGGLKFGDEFSLNLIEFINEKIVFLDMFMPCLFFSNVIITQNITHFISQSNKNMH